MKTNKQKIIHAFYLIEKLKHPDFLLHHKKLFNLLYDKYSSIIKSYKRHVNKLNKTNYTFSQLVLLDLV